MNILILILIFLLLILIYNNTQYNTQYKIEKYLPADYSSSIDVRLCGEEMQNLNDLEYDLNELNKLQTKNNVNDVNNVDDVNDVNDVNDTNINNKIKLTKVKSYIDSPFYHAYNLETIDNFELTKSDYSIINNIKLQKNQAFAPKNYLFNIL